MWNLNTLGYWLSKDNQALVIKKDKNGHNFDLKTTIEEGLMLVLSLLHEKKKENLRINCISWLLTVVFIFLILFSTRMWQKYPRKLVFFSSALFILYTSHLWFLHLHLLLLWRLWQLQHLHIVLCNIILEIKASFVFCFKKIDCFCLSESWPVSL